MDGAALGELPGVIEELPTQFNEATNRTIELIDVLWLMGNSIVAAFGVECTTSIYSGLLRALWRFAFSTAARLEFGLTCNSLRPLWLPVVIAFLLFGAPGAIQAALLASEEFEYAQVDDITDARGGIGWEDAWTGRSFITVGSLAFPGLANHGHKLTTSGAEGGAENVKCSFRTLSIRGHEGLVDEGRFGKDHTTLWIAFVVNSPSGLSAGFGGLSLYDGERQRLFLGDTGTSNVWGMDVGRWTHRFSDVPADRTPCLLVYRITFLPGDEKIDMWVNPTLGGEQPPEGLIAAQAGGVPDFRFNRVRLCSAPLPLNFDALRIGTTFADVAPAESAAAVPDAPAAPPPPARNVRATPLLSLLILAGGGLPLVGLLVLLGLLWRRKRVAPPRIRG